MLDKKKNYRKIKFGTLKHSTHLNSVASVGKTKHFEDTIYCSLFHQGDIIAIDKKTGNFKVVLSELKHPHAIRVIGKKIILSDTENGKIIITDHNLKIKKKFKIPNSNWIQDSSILPNGNILITDSNNNRILEFDQKNEMIIDSYNYSKKWKIFSAEAI